MEKRSEGRKLRRDKIVQGEVSAVKLWKKREGWEYKSLVQKTTEFILSYCRLIDFQGYFIARSIYLRHNFPTETYLILFYEILELKTIWFYKC